MDTCRVPYKKKRENGIRALYDPLERCSLLFLSQYLCLSFPIDENHTSKGRRGHSHEMMNGYCVRVEWTNQGVGE